MKTAGLLILIGYFLIMLLNSNRIASTVQSQAQLLVDVQTTTSQHTADANAAIDWAMKTNTR